MVLVSYRHTAPLGLKPSRPCWDYNLTDRGTCPNERITYYVAHVAPLLLCWVSLSLYPTYGLSRFQVFPFALLFFSRITYHAFYTCRPAGAWLKVHVALL